jgi:prepilin-type N-terminal cleavage/methylation domain-containing protein
MLSKFRKSEEGFTLIELLIVVAIIGILAAIAIPQFSAYRQRAYNGAANADLKNARTAQESLFADYQTYGKSQGVTAATGVLLGGVTNTIAQGDVAGGPMASATATVQGLALSGPRNSDGLPVGIGTGISNGVVFESINAVAAGGGVAPAFGATTYGMNSKHTQGTRVFATETEGTAIYYVENPLWAGVAMTATGLPAEIPVNAANTAELFNGAASNGAAPITTLSAL